MHNYQWQKILFFKFDDNILKVICLYFFAFGNHNAILNVLSDLSNPSKKRCLKVLDYSFKVEFYVYSVVMITGYFSTFQETKEIYIDREDQSIFLVLGKLLYIVALTCHIGLYYYISKPSFENLFNRSEKFSESKYLIFCLFYYFYYRSYWISVFILCALNTVAYFFKSILSIISFIGSTCNIYMIFIMPSKIK